MASSLEFGKLMATSFLYRYWNKINKLLKIYLTCAVLVLMGITSLGVFGFLSQAFYSTKSSIDAIESQLSLLEAKKISLQSQIVSNNDRIKTLTDTRKNQEGNLTKVLDQSTTTTVTKSGGFFGNDTQEKVIDKKSVELKSQTLNSVQSNITSLESNIEKINNINSNLLGEINQLDTSVIDLKSKITKSDIGTYKFIAEAFNVKMETVVKYFILIIVSVFDPLAVSLLLAYNIVANRKFEENEAKEIIIEKIIEKPIEIIKNLNVPFKRGTKTKHNPDLADPDIKN
jgi:cell division protein FtsL